MKNKIIRILLSVLFVIIFLLYIGPVITVGEYNLGIIAGLGFDFILLIYIIFFNKINLLIKNINKKKVGKIALKIISFVLFICIIIGGTTFHNVLSRSFKSEEKSDVAIVLGCVVNGDKPGIFLKGRINAAYKYLNENPNAIAVLSGGQGNGENISEAKCMFNCLTEMGIDKSRLLIEDKSTSTRENFKYSKEIIEKNGIKSKKITIITNDFHECRASEFAKQNGFKPLRYPSKTPWNGYMPFATRAIFAIIYQIYLARYKKKTLEKLKTLTSYFYFTIPFLNITNAPKTDTTTPIGIKTPVPSVPLKIKINDKTAMGRIDIFQCFARYEAQREPKSAGVTC